MPALKNFGITFLISALIFSVVAYFVVGFLTSTVSGILEEENDRLDELFTAAPVETSGEDTDDLEVLPEVEGDSFSVLFAVTDRRDDVFDYLPEDEDEIDAIKTGDNESVGLLTKDYRTVKVKSIVLMRVCKETGDYTIIPIPSVSKVYTQMGGGYTLLEDVMYFYDKEYFTQKVSAMTGITPDYTVFANVTDMAAILSATGGFTCYIPEDIYTDGKNYVPEPEEETTDVVTESVTDVADSSNKTEQTTGPEEEEVVLEKVVSAGNVTVGASNIEAILLYENYENGMTDRSELLAEVLKGFMSKLSHMDDTDLSQVYTSLTKKNKIDTDMTESELLSKGELIRAYSKFNVTVSEYPGAKSGEYFVPDVMKAAKQYLGLRLPPDPAKGS